MDPQSLDLTNFHRYADLHLDFADGATIIVGPNGAGKSSLLEAIDVALFGGRGHVTTGETSGSVMLTFEHRGNDYRIRRGWKSGKPTLDLERCALGPSDLGYPEGWTPETRENVSATQAYIEELLGVSRDTLLASSILMQNDGAAFCAAKPAERKRLLAGALGLHVWALLRERVRDELRAADRDLAVAQAAAERLTQEVKGRAQLETMIDETLAAVAEAQAAVDAAQHQLTLVSERYQAARDQAAKRQALEAELQAARAALEQLQRADVAATEAVAVIGVARDELVGLPTATEPGRLEQRIDELRAQIDQHREQQRTHEFAVAENARVERERRDLIDRARESLGFATDVEAKAAALEAAPDPVCQTCAQPLPDDARARAVQSYRDEASAHKAAAQRLILEETQLAKFFVPPAPEGDPPTRDLDTVIGQLKSVQASTAKRAQLEERIASLELTVAARPTQEALADATAACFTARARLDELEPVDIASIEEEGRAAKDLVETRQRTLTGHREQLASQRTRLEQIVARETELATSHTQIADLHTYIDARTRAEKAYGPAGIPALILENAAIPQIETRANQIVQALGWTYTLRLDTQREKKSGDGVMESLDIVVETDLGEQTWERCSGGEKQRVNLALRLAIAELIATRRGVEVKLLAIDEPDGLDADGFQALVDLLADLEARGVFSKILVVSHHPELKTAFEQVIEVTGGGRLGSHSRLAGAREAVAA